MRLRPVRFVVLSLAIIAWSLVWSSGEGAVPRSKLRPGSRTRSSASQSNSPSRTAPTTTTAPSTRPAARTARATSRPAAPPRDPAQVRAEFQKLIEASWIWSPAYEKDNVPVGDCYFRRTVTVGGQVEFAQVHVACDNHYELFVNGQPAGSGSDWRKMDVHDISKLMRPGVNVIGVKATNADEGAAGLVARVILKERGGTFESFSTDDSWRTSVKQFANWAQPGFLDREWLPANVYGPLGGVLPWGDEVVIGDEGSRFMIDPEFAVERLVGDDHAGSLIAMEFNSQGDILASQEGGPLLLVRDADRDGTFESVQPYCDQLKNVQGILSLGGIVMAVGEGPEGGALYRLADEDNDDVAEAVTALVKFRGLIGEHGPHAVQLGPEGLVYVLCGNFARADAQANPQSPYSVTYEGDLIKPKYEDPQGHAVGVPAPGGTIIRTDTSGSFVEVVAGGFRNPYDFAFNADGELFTYDADMEWDIGTPWYRPTRVTHVPPGGEFGWRSGWSKWPEYYPDGLPAIADLGPGSPTGVVVYDHVMFPQRLQGSLIIGDWALGQIHAVSLERRGATYRSKVTTLLKGRPLNVTDLAVGPDGSLYFCTGGRGTDGGIYRLRWTGTVPPEATNLGDGIQQAIRQPQLQGDWARRNIAIVQRQLGDRWGAEITSVLTDRRASSRDRVRALDVMTIFGPAPTHMQLIELSRDPDAALRAKVARLMGTQSDPVFAEPLAQLLEDSDAGVRRVTCEAIAHRGGDAPVDGLVRLLADRDRFVAFSARRALEGVPVDQWQEKVFAAQDMRTFLQGSAGLLAVAPTGDTARRVLERCEAMLRGEVRDPGRVLGRLSEHEFRDTIRVIQLALARANVPPEDVPGITRQILLKYPTTDPLANREMVRLLAYLQPPEAAGIFAQQLEGNIGDVEKFQVAAYAARLKTGWDTESKLTLLRYYETMRGIEGGHSVNAYMENFARDFFTNLSLAERRHVIAAGERFPTSALSILAKLPSYPGGDVLAEICALDSRLDGMEGESIARLRVGIVAVLGGSGDPDSLAYLRDIYRNQPDRRDPVAMSLTQHPEGENWELLVDSLRSIDGIAAPEVLTALAKADRRPESADAYRNVILLGLRQTNSCGELAIGLLEHWTGLRTDNGLTAEQLASWQAWYAEQFPDALAAALPKESTPNRWSFDELAMFLENDDGQAGDATRGAHVFHDAQCVNCHRFRGAGERIGPDLTTVAQRFQRKEVLESIVYPSHVVSDQYASQTVLANGRTYSGIAVRDEAGNLVVLQSDGRKVELAADDIEEIEPSRDSAMPEGLLNPLSLEQVADLFAYLMNTSSANVADRSPGTTR